MRIAYLYTDGRLRRKQRTECGGAATDFFYGSEELRRKGYDVGLFELASYTASRWIRFAGDWLWSHNLTPHKMYGELLGQMKCVLPFLSGYDIVVVAGSPTAYTLATWKRLGFLEAEILAIQCGMLNYEFTSSQRFWTRHLQGFMWTMLFGEGEYEPFCQFVGEWLAERIVVNECGTDTTFWTPGGTEEGYIFSIGNDGRRDYDLLMRVAKTTGFPFVVVTRNEIKEAIPANVRLIKGDLRKEILSDEEVRDLYRRASMVVVPLTESYQPSGQSVCLQAMACEKPVILTRTKGLWSRTKMRDRENVIMVPPGDPEELEKNIRYLWDQPDLRRAVGKNGLETVRKEWDMYGYAERIESICQKIVGQSR